MLKINTSSVTIVTCNSEIVTSFNLKTNVFVWLSISKANEIENLKNWRQLNLECFYQEISTLLRFFRYD